jgi:anaerobic ribonucleoside-triphosphate reductase activating protein
VSPEWIPDRLARLMEPRELAAELLADPAVGGLTLSGGEPMAQAGPLAAMVRAAREIRDVTVVCFTGFPLAKARAELLSEVDVLVDGPYIQARNDGRGLRGSTNQRVHYFTDRITPEEYDFTGRQRTAEIRVRDRDAVLVGVPPLGLLERFDEAVNRFRERP